MGIFETLGIWIIEKLAGWGISWAVKKHAANNAANSLEKANDQQAYASADAAQIRERSDAAIEQARQQTDRSVADLHASAVKPGGVQRERDTVQQAIERANADDSVR